MTVLALKTTYGELLMELPVNLSGQEVPLRFPIIGTVIATREYIDVMTSTSRYHCTITITRKDYDAFVDITFHLILKHGILE